jgi:hypothetical protein
MDALLRSVLLASLVALTAACSSSGQQPAGSGSGGSDAALEAAAGSGGSGGDSAADAAPDTSVDAALDAGTDADASSTDASSTDASDASPADAAADADAQVDYDAQAVDGSSCGALIQQHPIEGALHVTPCSQVSYGTNPPSSGNHYPIWADYKTYTRPVPRGFWVHNLEHGAVVITYNCPGGCAGEVAQAQSVIDSYADLGCFTSAGVPRRIVMTPDPLLDVRWAASSWGWTLRASCFEPAVFLKFIQDHYNHAPENECHGDWDFQPDGGPLVLPCSDAGADGG